MLWLPIPDRNPAKWPLMNACLPHAELMFATLTELAVDAGLQKDILHEWHSAMLGVDAGVLIGNLQGAQGASEKARKIEEQALEIASKRLDPDDTRRLTAMSNLAGTLRGQGDLEGARKLQQKALDAYTRILGGEHPNTLGAMDNLAGTLRAQSDLEGARKLQKQALGARTRVLGAEHPDTTISAWNLFSILRAQGRTEGAKRFWKRI